MTKEKTEKTEKLEKSFVHLHLHTDLSLLESIIQTEHLVKRLKELKMKAVAMTDSNNLFGALTFYNAMNKAKIKPIIGIEMDLETPFNTTDMSNGSNGSNVSNLSNYALNAHTASVERVSDVHGHIVLLCKDYKGYQNLVRLTSFAYIDSDGSNPRITLNLLRENAEGLIALSGCNKSIVHKLAHLSEKNNIYKNKDHDHDLISTEQQDINPDNSINSDKSTKLTDYVTDILVQLQEIFGDDLYLEIQDHGLAKQKVYNDYLIELSEATNIPLVATNDCHYLTADDYEAHDALLAMGAGKSLSACDRTRYSAHHYVKSAEEMWQIFSDMPEVLLRTVEIAEKCNLVMPPTVNHMPEFPVPAGFTMNSYFEKLCWEGLEKKKEKLISMYEEGKLKTPFDEYLKRLQYEIEMINRMGFAGYFLITWDLILYAKQNNIPTGIARGCLSSNTRILTSNYISKEIKDVKIGELVITRSGSIERVIATHVYPCKEDLIKIKTYYGDSTGVTMTHDHKVLAEKMQRVEGYAKWSAKNKQKKKSLIDPVGNFTWFRADHLSVGDWVFTPYPRIAHFGCIYTEALHRFANGKDMIYNETDNTVEEYYINPLTKTKKITQILPSNVYLDENWCRILGYFTGNGWLRKDSTKAVGFCFNTSHIDKIKDVEAFAESIGIPFLSRAHKTKHATQIILRSKFLYCLFKSLFPEYKYKSYTKHIPWQIMEGSRENKQAYIKGYMATDGSYINARSIFTTSSYKLAEELRWLVLSLGYPSAIARDNRIDSREEFKNRREAYTVTIPSVEIFGVPNAKAAYHYRFLPNGIATKIKTIENVGPSSDGNVYDLSISNEENYLTTSFLVHNSAGGSLASYVLDITRVDPLKYDLMFERFLNPDRVSLPDIDLDFCVRGRQQVIQYVTAKYHSSNVSQIVTFGTMASRAAIKDMGRVLDVPFQETEKIAKMLPPPFRGRHVPLVEAIANDEALRKEIEADERITKAVNLAKRIEGCARHSSLHAAGIVISPKPLYELIPVYKSPKGEIASQYEMGDLEKAGMLKMDFLGLSALTMMDDCLKLIKKSTGKDIDLDDIPLDDKPSLDLFGRGQTDAIFQFESDGMASLCKKMQPESPEHLSAINALYRPGPIDSGMVDDYVERRHGRAEIVYELPELESVLGTTYGVPTYQEQIMAIFQKLAGYTLAEADLVRRALGKKIREELAVHKEKFINQSANNGHSTEIVSQIWDRMSGFADYCFNLSHSMSYGLLAYQTAYLKANYPACFWAAVLSNEVSDAEKMSRYIDKAQQMNIRILPPDINISDGQFTVESNQIRFGLSGIKGLGEAAVDHILESRKQGEFKSVFDFAARAGKAANRKILECLIKAGAFDKVSQDSPLSMRAKMLAGIDIILNSAQSAVKKKLSNQTSIFDMLNEPLEYQKAEELPNVPPLSKLDLLKQEKEMLNFYISGHPLEAYRPLAPRVAKCSIKKMKSPSMVGGAKVSFIGMIADKVLRNTKKGDKFAILQFEDWSDDIKVILWPKKLNEFTNLLSPGIVLLVKGTLEKKDNSEITVFADSIETVDDLIADNIDEVTIAIAQDHLQGNMIQKLHDIVTKYRGNVRLIFEIDSGMGYVSKIKAGVDLWVDPKPDLFASIKEILPAAKIMLN